MEGIVVINEEGQENVSDTTFTTYNLNKAKAMDKLQQSCERKLDMDIVATDGGLVLTFSAGGFLLFKNSLHTFFKEQKLLTTSTKTIKDKQSKAVVQESISVFDIAGQKKKKEYVINLYLTTCRVLINGKHENRFFNTDMKAISHIMHGIRDNHNISEQSINEFFIKSLDKFKTNNNHPEKKEIQSMKAISDNTILDEPLNDSSNHNSTSEALPSTSSKGEDINNSFHSETSDMVLNIVPENQTPPKKEHSLSMKVVNRALNKMSENQTPEKIFLNKISKVDKLEQSLIVLKEETHNSMEKILQSIENLKNKSDCRENKNRESKTLPVRENNRSPETVGSDYTNINSNVNFNNVSSAKSLSTESNIHEDFNNENDNKTTPIASSSHTLSDALESQMELEKNQQNKMDKIISNSGKPTTSADTTGDRLDDFESSLFIGDEIVVDGSKYRGYSAVVNSVDEAFAFIGKLITSSHMKTNNFQHFHSAYAIGNVIVDAHEDKGSINIKNILKRNGVNSTVVVVCRSIGNNYIHNKRWDSVSLATTSVLKKMGFLKTKENTKQNKEIQIKGSENSNSHSEQKNQRTSDHQNTTDRKDEDYIPVLSQKGKHSDPYYFKSKPETILLIDSVGKHVDSKRFLGKRSTLIHICPNTTYLLGLLNKWHVNNATQNVVLHVGINDICEERECDSIVQDMIKCIEAVKEKTPKANIVYSNIILCKSAPVDYLNKSASVNNKINLYCHENGVKVVTHNNLCRNNLLYATDDYKHINYNGTKIFVKNLHNAIYRIKSQLLYKNYGNNFQYNGRQPYRKRYTQDRTPKSYRQLDAETFKVFGTGSSKNNRPSMFGKVHSHTKKSYASISNAINCTDDYAHKC